MVYSQINLFVMMAGYNAWANARLYDAAALMTPGLFYADGGAFFGSVHRTLNHLLVTDRIWLKRFGVRDEAPDRLDAILFEDLPELQEARSAEDTCIEQWVRSLGEADLASTISYRRATSPDEISQPLATALSHLFNHQTHHRGQVHALMTALESRDFAPSLDLLIYQRETGVGMI